MSRTTQQAHWEFTGFAAVFTGGRFWTKPPNEVLVLTTKITENEDPSKIKLVANTKALQLSIQKMLRSGLKIRSKKWDFHQIYEIKYLAKTVTRCRGFRMVEFS